MIRMILFLTILTGSVVAVIGMKKGFLPMWAMLFNVLLSIYLSVMLTPTIIGNLDKLADNPYYCLFSMLTVAMLSFVITQMLIARSLRGIFIATLPRIFNGIGAGVLGFMVGYFVSNFILFLICITPLSNQPIVKNYIGKERLSQVVNATMVSVCNTVSELSCQDDEDICLEVVDWYLEK